MRARQVQRITPGTGKTHTVRYLLGQLPGVTVVVLSGAALGTIAAACSIARTLQPSAVIVEDVDLIAEERTQRMGQHPLLFQLLNEMDGLAEDADVTFLLTTNRADLLERALTQRPGRVDHAALLPLPDAEARGQLIRLYQGRLQLDLTDPGAVIARTEGVTASFIKELLRRAALLAAESADQVTSDAGHDNQPLRVTDEHLTAALDQLLDTRNELTRLLLGGQAPGTSREPRHRAPSSKNPVASRAARPRQATGTPAVVHDLGAWRCWTSEGHRLIIAGWAALDDLAVAAGHSADPGRWPGMFDKQIARRMTVRTPGRRGARRLGRRRWNSSSVVSTMTSRIV